MLIHTLKSKISYATVTHRDLFYVGSITIDWDIMEQAHIRENEQVHIVNLNNGERLVTYVITGEAGSGVFALNGPAARKAEIGDQIFILSYAMIDPAHETLIPQLVDVRDLV
jgi:aspartate 1-decarboxylase